MAKPLVTVGPGKELESGLFPGVDPLSAPFWADGENVEFRKGGVVSSAGYSVIATLTGEVSEMAQAYVEGDKRIYGAVGPSVIMSSTLSGLSVLGEFPSVGTPYFETFGSFLLGTNGVDPLMVWRNTGAFEAIAGTPFSFAKLIHRRDNHVIALNTSNGQNAYEWCSASDIDDWTPSEANSAGNNWIRDLDSDIVAVCDLGRSAAVYSRETMGIIDFVGQPYVFSHSPALNGVGAVGPRSIVQIGDRNAGLNRQGIFLTDGVSFQYVDDPAVSDFLDEDVDFDLGESIKAYHNEDLSSAIWFYTSKEGVRRGIGFSYTKGTFQKYTTQALVALERQVFSDPVAAVGASLVLLDQGHNAAGAPFSKWIRTKPISGGDGTIWKVWSHLKAVGQWQDAQVRFGLMEDPTQPQSSIQWFSTQDLAFEVWIDREAPYIVLEFRADVLDSYFSFSQLQLQGEPTALVSA